MSEETATFHEICASYVLRLPDMSSAVPRQPRDSRHAEDAKHPVVMLVCSVPVHVQRRGPHQTKLRVCHHSSTGWRFLCHRKLLGSGHTRRSAAVPSSTSIIVRFDVSTCAARSDPVRRRLLQRYHRGCCCDHCYTIRPATSPA